MAADVFILAIYSLIIKSPLYTLEDDNHMPSILFDVLLVAKVYFLFQTV